MINYELSLLIALCAFTYSVILTQPKMIFYPLYKFLSNKFVKEEPTGQKEHWFFKIIIHCEKCVAGQWALWVYLYLHLWDYISTPIETLSNHAAFVLITIFIITIIKPIHEKWLS